MMPSERTASVILSIWLCACTISPISPKLALEQVQNKKRCLKNQTPLVKISDPVGARTQNLQLRRLLLYPVELRNQSYFWYRNFVKAETSPLKLRKSNTKFPICKISSTNSANFKIIDSLCDVAQYKKKSAGQRLDLHSPCYLKNYYLASERILYIS